MRTMAEALYRKYRPQVFGDVVGQDHIETTLRHAVEQNKVSHAYLFTGPRGTGKTTTARLLAKALLCGEGMNPDPDGTCEDCLMIAEGSHPDVYELDAASRTGVDNVREEIIGRVNFAPTRGRFKVYIIDEVHMLSTAAFNALLKTLEEPPAHIVFILCTTDPQKVPETIHSRCQRFDFHRISQETVVSRLGAVCVAEGVEFEGEALDLIAHRCDGGMRNALTSLEQLIAYGQGKVTLEAANSMLGAVDTSDVAELVSSIARSNAAAAFSWVDRYVETGADLAQFTRDLAAHVRNLYILSVAGGEVTLDVGEAVRRELSDELPLFGPARLSRMLCVLGDLTAELKTSSNARLSFEIALTRMIRPESELTLEALAQRVEQLEQLTASLRAQIADGRELRPCPSSAESTAPAAESPATALPSPTQAARTTREQPAADTPTEVHDFRAKPAVGQPRVEQAVATPERATAASNPVARAAIRGLADNAAVKRTWEQAVSLLKKEKAAYGALFLNTRAEFDATRNTVLVVFDPESEFAFRAVAKPDIVNAVSQALAHVLGQNVSFEYTKGPARAAANYGSATQVAQAGGRENASAPAREAKPVPPANAAPETAAHTPEAAAQGAPRREEPAPNVFERKEAFADNTPKQSEQALQAKQAEQAQQARAAHPAPAVDDIVPYDDEYVPYEDEEDPFADEPIRRSFEFSPDSVSPSPSAIEASAASQPAAHVSPAESHQPAESAQPAATGHLDNDLAEFFAGFGEGVVISEI